MKKILIATFALTALIACNSGGDTKATDAEKKDAGTPATSTAPDPASNPDYEKGLALVGQSDCFTCHKVDEGIQGPSYRDVANKYAGEGSAIVPKLAEKIIKGGTGVWGQVPMIAHPAISQEDAEAMVKYILLLKK